MEIGSFSAKVSTHYELVFGGLLLFCCFTFANLHFDTSTVSHILVSGPESDAKCMALKDLVRRKIDFPAGVGLAQAFAEVQL